MTEMQIRNAIRDIDRLFNNIYDPDVTHLLKSAIMILKSKLPKERVSVTEQPYKIVLDAGSKIKPFVIYKHYKSNKMDIWRFGSLEDALFEMNQYPEEIRKVNEVGLRRLGLSWGQIDEILVELGDEDAITKLKEKEFRKWMKERK